MIRPAPKPTSAAAPPAPKPRRRINDDPPLPPEPPEPPPPRPPPEPPAEPPTGPAPPAQPTNASITSWTRLEPSCRDDELQSTSGARVFDPLWLLTRQWQLGEFQAEDAGTPVRARVRATSAPVTRVHLGDLPPDTRTQAAPFDVSRQPLEALVERRRMRAAPADEARLLPLAVDAGLHFLRLLALQPLSRNYRAAFIARFAFAQATEGLDSATERFVQTMAGRAPDARQLAAALRAKTAAQVAADTALKIVAADRAEVALALQQWLAWYDELAAEPARPADDAWLPARLEYAVTVAARLSERPEDEFSFSAGEFDDGRLDWSRFDRNAEVAMGSGADRAFRTIVETTVPAPISFRGAPAARFWEMEDARLDYGLVPVGPTDLAQLMMIQYAGSYGNDWFVIPLTLAVGSVTRIESLIVTDTFGVHHLLRPIGDPGGPSAHWSMWQHGHRRRAGQALLGPPEHNLFFLPPTLGSVLDGAPLEDVLFMRDEMANMAWAIERSIESPLERPLRRDDATPAAAEPRPATGLNYRLASSVPAHWVPLLPVQVKQGETIVSRLKRGAVLQPDGSARVHRALGDALNAVRDGLFHDEEIPREGVHVTKQRRLARWIDGSTWWWTSLRANIGRGEGSAGLRFDRIEDPSAQQGAPPA